MVTSVVMKKKWLYPSFQSNFSGQSQKTQKAHRTNENSKQIHARENACEHVTIAFDFASHWLRKWREFCQPIIDDSKSKQSKRELLSTLF